MVGAMASGVGSALGKIGKLPKKKPEDPTITPETQDKINTLATTKGTTPDLENIEKNTTPTPPVPPQTFEQKENQNKFEMGNVYNPQAPQSLRQDILLSQQPKQRQEQVIQKYLNEQNTQGAEEIIKNIDVNKNMLEEGGLISGVGGNIITQATNNPIVAETTQELMKGLNTISGWLPEMLQFSAGKSAEVKKAEASFTDAYGYLDVQSKTLATGGNVDMIQLNQAIDDAIYSIQTLQAETKGLGRVSVRYWLDKGFEIEQQTNREIALLEAKRTELLLNYQKGQLVQSMAQRGLQNG